MNKRVLLPVVAAVALAGGPGMASAIPFEITGGTATTSGVTVGSTVDVSVSDGLARTFDLDAGETTERFDFLDVSVSGLGVTAGYINAQMNFEQPTVASAEGVLAGFSVILGWAASGVLTVLNDPGPIAFGDGGWFDVDFFGFSDACLSYCTSLSGSVQATVSLLRAPGTVSVPEPATLSLLGAGLLALGLTRRRRRA